MVRVVRAAAVCATVAALLAPGTASAGTSFVTTWKSPDARPGAFAGQKVMAIIITTDQAQRRGLEEILGRELIKRGLQGMASYNLIPLADVKDEALVKSRLEQVGVAAAVVMRLVSRDQEISSQAATYYAMPMYDSFYGGYWGFGWGAAFDPGAVRNDTVLRVETLVYSLAQNKLVWAGQSKTTNPRDATKFIQDLLGKVVDQMKKDGLLK